MSSRGFSHASILTALLLSTVPSNARADAPVQPPAPGIGRRDLPEWAPQRRSKVAPPEVKEKDFPGMQLQPIPIPSFGSQPVPMPGSSIFEFLERARSAQKTFKFDIDPNALPIDLLPGAPNGSRKAPGLFNEDLANVVELMLGEPLSKELDADQAMEKIAHIAAKINHLNNKRPDGFMRDLAANRRDLDGLPFLLGDDCRTPAAQAELSAAVARASRLGSRTGNVFDPFGAAYFWVFQDIVVRSQEKLAKEGQGGSLGRAPREGVERAFIALQMQTVIPGTSPYGPSLPNFLAKFNHADATRALARLAIFSADVDVRIAATQGLRARPTQDFAGLLVNGLSYPLPAVSKRAAELLVELNCKEALPELVKVLERPDPRLPVARIIDGQEVSSVRELVRVNHHRNCFLCHAPANTPDVQFGTPRGVIPLPGEPFPLTPIYYSNPPSPDIVVRADITYLRQDFSLMMPVDDAAPWPEMQRFDFLVRTRTLSAAEAVQVRDQLANHGPGAVSPYHRDALYALRSLTGRDAGTTAEAWRRVVNP